MKEKILKIVIAIAITASTLNLSMFQTYAKEDNLVQYTDTLFGTDVDKGSTSAGPSLPNGSIHPSPETTPPDNGGYHKGNPVVGFGQLYTQGSGGTKSYGNFLLSPQTGDIKTQEKDHSSKISEEKGQANYYTAKLDKYNIKAEVTPESHSALYRFTYPEDEESSLVLDVSRKIGGEVAMKSGSIKIDKDNKKISGGGTFSKNWNPNDWNMYFSLEFDADIKEIGTWDNNGLNKDNLNLNKKSNNEHFGAYIKFDTSSQQIVHVKISISFVSVEKADAFLNKEIPNFDFDTKKEDAKKVWNDVLSKVELAREIDEKIKQKFYTALYHTNIQPRDRTEDHGTWDDYYTLWDSWRTVFPFLQLTRPEMVASNINSFIKRYKNNGKMSDAYIQGKEYICGQGGNDIENVIADAYLKGIEGVDWEAAYAVVKGEAENYRSQQYQDVGYHYSGTKAINGDNYSWRIKPSSATVGFAYNDYAVAMMAKGLGKEDDYKKYIESSKKWLNNWDDNLIASDGYKGFIHKRDANGNYAKVDPSELIGIDGTEKQFKGYNDDFYEAGIWEGSYSPTFDLTTLIEKMGGKYAYADRLNFALEQGYMNFANEPSFQTIWTLASDEVQRPDLASHWVNDYLSMYTDDGYPGDEDNGAMSSMYMFMMSGFFPMSGTNNYYLHGTHLPLVTYHLGTGKDFIIKGINVNEKNIYVQSAKWNGKNLNTSQLTYEQIKNGGTLEYVMGDKPSDWARVTDNEKPSNVENIRVDNTEINDGKLSLKWDAAQDNTEIKEYNIYSSIQEDFLLNNENFVTSTKETMYTFDASKDTLYFRIEAVDYFGNKSENPPTIKVETMDKENPIMVGKVDFDSRYLDVGLIRLNWQAAMDNTKVKEYRIYKGSKSKYDLDNDSLISTTKDLYYTETKAKGTFYYKICAVDIFGNVSEPLSVQVVCDSELQGKKLDLSTNIAKNKTVKTSGHNNVNESGEYAVDGKKDTKWCSKEAQSSDKPNFWLEVDLGDTYQINKWVVKHATESGISGELPSYNTKDFKLQVKSNDEWLDIDTVIDNTDGLTSRTTAMFEGRYIRLYIMNPVQANNNTKTVRVYEFELYANEELVTFNGSIMNNPDIIAKVNGQANENEGANKAFDFDSSTKWSCRNNNDDNGFYWLEVKMPYKYNVSSMYLLSAGKENKAFITKEFSLQVKEDNEWKNVNTVKNNIDNLYHEQFDKSVVGDEFRLLIPKLGNESANNARILEFHLYGDKVIEKAQLFNLYELNKNRNSKDYTTDSWKDFFKALRNAKIVLDDENATQGDVNSAMNLLNIAIDNLKLLANKQNLKELINEVSKLNAKEYTTDSWKAFSEVLNQANAIDQKEDATQKEVDDIVNALKARRDTLIKKADKTALNCLLEEMNKLDAKEYTTDSWKAFSEVLNQANTIDQKEDATQKEVDDIVNALKARRDTLIKKADKTALNCLLEEMNKLNAKEYTTDSWKAFSEVLNQANTIDQKEDATQKEVDDIVNALKITRDALIKKADKTVLKELIDKVNELDENLYTVDSYKSLLIAKDFAQQILDNQDVTETQIEEAINALEKAIELLVDVPKINADIDKDIDDTSKEETNGTNTSDMTPIMMMSIMMVGTGILLYTIMKKMKYCK